MENDNLYAILQDIKTDIAVVKTQLEKFADHEDRIRELEKARWSSSWVTALVTSTATAVLITLILKGIN